MTAPGELAMFLAIGAAAAGILFGPIGAAVARRMGGHSERDEDHVDAEMHARVTADVDDLRTRLAEVEERLDFAERLLAQAREADQLPGGAHQ